MTPTSRVVLAVALIGACGSASCASPPQDDAALAGEADARFRCGATPVRAAYADDAAVLTVGEGASGRTHELSRSPAASGSLYDRIDENGRVAFRTEGEGAALSVYGRRYPACVATGAGGADATPDEGTGLAPADLAGAPWSIEDVVGMGVVDAGAPRIAFGEDGRVSGRTGCNDFAGSYELTDGALSLGRLALTRKRCPEALARQERRIVRVLDDLARASLLADGELVLSAADDRSITARR